MTEPVVLVTGASRGIGLAVVTFLLESFGTRVITISRSISPQLKDLSTKHSDRIVIVQGDITNASVHEEAVTSARQKYNRLDAVILNAGTADPLGRVTDPAVSIDGWKSVFDINFFSLLHTLKAAIPSLRESQGRILMVSSDAAIAGIPGWGAYSASKSALNSLGRTLAKEEPNITSIAIRPGIVDTEMAANIRNEGSTSMDQNDHNRFVHLHTSGKLLTAEQPGHVIAALSLNAPKDLSGKFVSWDDDELKAFRQPV